MMRIVNQEGTYSVNFDNVSLYIQNDDDERLDTFDTAVIRRTIYAKSSEGVVPLGQYSSQQRAEEVFSEIHVRYADVRRNELVFKEEGSLMVNYCSEETLSNYLEKTKWSYLYQLPKE